MFAYVSMFKLEIHRRLARILKRLRLKDDILIQNSIDWRVGISQKHS